MNEQDNKDSIIASYELTASHKEEDSISEHEMDDMIRESEDENHTALPSQSQTRKISPFCLQPFSLADYLRRHFCPLHFSIQFMF